MPKFIIICAVVALISLAIITFMNNKPISILKPEVKRVRSKNANPQISIPTRPFIEDDNCGKSSDEDVHNEAPIKSPEFLNEDKVIDEAILVDIDAL